MTDHCCVLKSKTVRSAPRSPSMYRPSGDQRGDQRPCDPGTSVIWPLERSRMRMIRFEGAMAVSFEVKTILRPSGDQLASNWPKWGSCLSTVATTGCVLMLFGWLLKADISLAVLRRHFPASDRRAFPDGAISCG